MKPKSKKNNKGDPHSFLLVILLVIMITVVSLPITHSAMISLEADGEDSVQFDIILTREVGNESIPAVGYIVFFKIANYSDFLVNPGRLTNPQGLAITDKEGHADITYIAPKQSFSGVGRVIIEAKYGIEKNTDYISLYGGEGFVQIDDSDIPKNITIKYNIKNNIEWQTQNISILDQINVSLTNISFTAIEKQIFTLRVNCLKKGTARQALWTKRIIDGTLPSDKCADHNADGLVDQKDVDQIMQKTVDDLLN